MKQTVNKRASTTSALVNGASILAIAAVISKLLGTLQKIPLQNIGGDEVFGVYNAVYPFYTLILFLTTAGFPIAVSKFVSEYMAEGHIDEAKRVMRISAIGLTGMGILFCLLLLFGAGYVSQLIGNAQTKLAIQSVSFALLFVPLMAVIRGYFQGLQNMVPTGVSQVVEQFVRVITMIALLLYFTSAHYSVGWIAAGATFGTSTGAIAGLVVMLVYKVKEPNNDLVPTQVNREALGSLIKKLLLFAIPVCLGAIVVPILSIADAFTMPRILKLGGLSESEAMLQFGVYTRGLPLVQLVAIVFSSLSVALVPSIAEARLRQAWPVIRHRADISLRFTWLIGWAASCGLAIIAVPINRMLFTDDSGSLSMAILAFTAVFSSLNIITASILQGLGAPLIPALSLLFAAVIKVCLNIYWIPMWGIEGAASAAVLTFVIASLFNLLAIRSRTGLALPWRDYVFKPLVALMFMAISLWLWLQGANWFAERLALDVTNRMLATGISLTAVLIGMIVYLLTLLRIGVISAQELNHLPKLGGKLVVFMQKMRILKTEEQLATNEEDDR